MKPMNFPRWPVGFGPVVVPAGESVTVTAEPGRRFKGTKLVLTGDRIYRAGAGKVIAPFAEPDAVAPPVEVTPAP